MENRPNSKTPKKRTVRKTKTLVVSFKRQFDPNYTPDPGEQNSGELVTIPDMSLTVQQLLKNHARGIMSPVNINEGIYTDQEIPRFDDIVEMKQYKEDLAEKIKEVEERMKKRKEEAQEKWKKEKHPGEAPIGPTPSPGAEKQETLESQEQKADIKKG